MNGNTNPVEHQGGQSELEETKEDKAGAAKKTDQNRKKRENNKNKRQKVTERRKKVIREIKIEINDLQHLIDNETGVVRKLTQEDIV